MMPIKDEVFNLLLFAVMLSLAYGLFSSSRTSFSMNMADFRLGELERIKESVANGEVSTAIIILYVTRLNLRGPSFGRYAPLQGNNLTGSIPQQIGNMNIYLDFLDLSRNSLSGGIPSGIWILRVGVLNLSYNNFSGNIPPDSHFGDSSYIGNSLLCGRPILNKSCLGDYEPHRDSNFTDALLDWEHEEDSIISLGFYISMGLGFIIGFWGTFGTIMTNKSIRYAFFKIVDDIGDYIYVKVVLNKASLQMYFRNKREVI
ncbi:uncharacterized protein [Henckelia pumila]|uniref:uncharacterized protein isoform X2 n=1 Tax=Henckelia pumila TaxID=405737 RepID=UPI003C6E507C